MTYAEFIALVEQELLTGGDATKSELLNMTQTIESLVLPVFEMVALGMVADVNKQPLLTRTHTVALTTGVGNLTNVLAQCVFNGSIVDPDDSTVGPNMSYVPHYGDFIEASAFEPRLGYWHVKDNGTTAVALYYIRPGETVPTKTGNVQLTTPSVPDIPATSADDLEAPPEFINLAIPALANAARKELVRAA